MAKEQNLEIQILQAAEELFLSNGFAGTSTTDIAKRVGCNQALVHYYFRTKENLFLQVFMAKLDMILKTLQQPLLNQDADFFDKLRNVIGAYYDFLANDTRLPFFVINEMLGNKDRLTLVYEHFMRNTMRDNVFGIIDTVVQAEVAKHTIRPIDTVNFILDVVSLTVFNFIALPIYCDVSGCTDDEKQHFLKLRKDEIITLVINGIKNVEN